MKMRLRTIALTAIATASALWIGQSSAHDWYTGLKNDQNQDCCGGSDCAPLPAGVRVRPSGDGYDVQLKAGDLPELNEAIMGTKDPVTFHFTGNPGLSPDGQVHGCVAIIDIPTRKLRCLFLGGTT